MKEVMGASGTGSGPGLSYSCSLLLPVLLDVSHSNHEQVTTSEIAKIIKQISISIL